MKNLNGSNFRASPPVIETAKGRALEMLNTQSERLFKGLKELVRDGHLPWADTNIDFLPYDPVTMEFYKGVHHIAILNKTFQRTEPGISHEAREAGYSSSPWFVAADSCPGAKRLTRGAVAHTLAVDLENFNKSASGVEEYLSRFKGRTLAQIESIGSRHYELPKAEPLGLAQVLEDVLAAAASTGVRIYCLKDKESSPGYYPSTDALVVNMEKFMDGNKKDRLESVHAAMTGYVLSQMGIARGDATVVRESAFCAPQLPFGLESASDGLEGDCCIELLRAHYVVSCLFKVYEIEDPWRIPISQEICNQAIREFERKGDPAAFYLSMESFGSSLDTSLQQIRGSLGVSLQNKLQAIAADSAYLDRMSSERKAFEPGFGSSITIDASW